LLSSAFPPLRTGLAGDAVQAGAAHSFTAVPTDFDGRVTLGIRYADADVASRVQEATLRLHRWTEDQGWRLLESAVDTSHNLVTGRAPEVGVYAAFTTTVETSGERTDDALPGAFLLHSAYPNP